MRSYKYPDTYNTLNEDQSLIFDMILWGYNNGRHFFLTGDAGVGKSYLIRTWSDFCKLNNINLVKVAPTGVAAINVGGMTIHRLFKVPTHVVSEDLDDKQEDNCIDMIQYVDVCLIEEISMARIDVFDNLMANIKVANEMRAMYGKKPIMVILAGDFSQLPPVIKPDDRETYKKMTGKDIGNGYCFNSHYWPEYKFIPLILRQQMRQSDTKFNKALDNIKIGKKDDLPYINAESSSTAIPNGIWLCGTNATAEAKNFECMKNLARGHVSYAEKHGKVDMTQTTFLDELNYAVSARVVMLINDNENHQYVNGSLGTITKVYVRKNKIEITLDNGNIINVEPFIQTFYEYEVIDGKIHEITVGTLTQFPFKVAYAITIHKSQGQTYDQMNLIPEIWSPGQLYVALSRCKMLENIYIQPVSGQKIMAKHVKADPDIVQFLLCMDSTFERFKVFYNNQK